MSTASFSQGQSFSPNRSILSLPNSELIQTNPLVCPEYSLLYPELTQINSMSSSIISPSHGTGDNMMDETENENKNDQGRNLPSRVDDISNRYAQGHILYFNNEYALPSSYYHIRFPTCESTALSWVLGGFMWRLIIEARTILHDACASKHVAAKY